MITRIPMSSQLISYSGHPLISFSPPPTEFHCLRRRRFRLRASSLLLPLLPFPIDQVFVPSEAKTLHLYEARYIELLEESLFRKNKLLVHVVLDQISFGSTPLETSFVAKYGCLAILEKVEHLQIGALVSIRGVGRVEVLHIDQAQPYLTGEVIPLQDNVLSNIEEISSKVKELGEVLSCLNSLEMKLKALVSFVGSENKSLKTEMKDNKPIYSLIDVPGDALLQTRTANSLAWAEKHQSLDCPLDFIPPLAEIMSFAALQPISGATQLEMLELQREKLKAMEISDTQERLEKSMKLVKDNIAVVAAKLAIQSLERG